MSILSNEKIIELWKANAVDPKGTIEQFSRAIEAAVLEAQKQEAIVQTEMAITDSMLSAGAKMFESCLHSSADFKHHAYHVFSAMIAAAEGKK